MYQAFSILVMFLVTYIPRVLPLVFIKRDIHSRFIKSVLYYIPYSVLAALTFPAVFYSTGNVATGIIGTVVAIVFAFFNRKLIIVALAAVAAVFGFSFFL